MDRHHMAHQFRFGRYLHFANVALYVGYTLTIGIIFNPSGFMSFYMIDCTKFGWEIFLTDITLELIIRCNEVGHTAYIMASSMSLNVFTVYDGLAANFTWYSSFVNSNMDFNSILRQ